MGRKKKVEEPIEDQVPEEPVDAAPVEVSAAPEIPKGWPRVRAALKDRVDERLAATVTDEWRASRFSDSEALALIVDHGCVRPVDAESVQ